MTELKAYRRADGRIAVRNQIFVLPAVVCANQVALDVSKKISRVKYIEHQHGCAQIGDDLELTRSVFTRMALHPNVYSSLLVGLGCEAVSAKVVADRARAEHQQDVELVVIQESGGTLGAESLVEKWIRETDEVAADETRSAAPWNELVVGLLFENAETANSEPVRRLVDTLWNLGVRIVVPESDIASLRHVLDPVPRTPYGGESEERTWAMIGKMPALEAATGLSVAGAHVIIHIVTEPHAFGNPLAPTIRWCIDEESWRSFADDFDGFLSDDVEPDYIINELAKFTNGEPTVAEELGMDDFALHRIGPTV